MMRSLLIVTVTVLLAATCRADDPVEVAVIRLPEGAVQPQAVSDTGGAVHLIYLEGPARRSVIQYVRWDESDAPDFDGAIRVSGEDATATAMGTIRGPHLAVDPNGRPHVLWNGPAPKGHNHQSPLLYTRLNDTGDAFEPARNVLLDWKRTGLDGGSSIAIDDQGRVHLVWHGPADEGALSEDARRVWMIVSADGGDTFGAPMTVDTPERGACGCCGLRAFARPEGGAGVMYRTAYRTTDRAMRLILTGAETSSTPPSSILDPWKIGQCVMSSAFGLSRDDVLALAWETQRTVHLGVLDRTTSEVGVDVTMSRPPGTNRPQKHPTLVIDERGRILIAWAEGVGWNRGGDVAWQVFDANRDALLDETGRGEGLPVWGHPAAVIRPGGGFAVLY